MKWAWLLLASVATPALAQNSDLPPASVVERVLESQPRVAAGKARIDASQAQAAALRRGTSEFTAEGSISRRSIDNEGNFVDYDASLSRPFRLPSKAKLDRAAGAIGVSIAENQFEDSRHQAALSLATLWYDWLLAADLHRNSVVLVENQRALANSTRHRMDVRDASDLEFQQASSAEALAQAQASDAVAQRDRARALLEIHYPDLPLPDEAPALAEPILPANLIDLTRLIVERSHEIFAAAGTAEREAIMARRARLDRFADPSLGVRVFSERSGQERGAGLTASLPLGGGHRRALADQAIAQASAARAEQTIVEREVRANAEADAAELRARFSAWQASRDAVARAEKSASLATRGQQLGAIDLSDRLYAERQANEARAQELNARATVARLILKLRIDAHELWID